MSAQKPVGALVIVGFLAVVILVSWFGMYAIFTGRS